MHDVSLVCLNLYGKTVQIQDSLKHCESCPSRSFERAALYGTFCESEAFLSSLPNTPCKIDLGAKPRALN